MKACRKFSQNRELFRKPFLFFTNQMDTKPKKKKFYRQPQKKSGASQSRTEATITPLNQDISTKIVPRSAASFAPAINDDDPPLMPGQPQPPYHLQPDASPYENAPKPNLPRFESLPEEPAGNEAMDVYFSDGETNENNQAMNVYSSPTALGNQYDPNRMMNLVNNSPYLEKIRKNENEINRLREMTAHDKDGRWWSALKALEVGLARAFDPKNGVVKDGGDFAARLAYAGGAALGGAVRPKWNEKMQIERDILHREEDSEKLRKQMEFENKYFYQQAQTAEILRRPQKEAETYKQKLEMESTRQANRLGLLIERDKLQGKKYRIETAKDGSGRLIKKFPDREEPFLDENGEQIINPLEVVHKKTLEDGTEVHVKGSQILSHETAEKWRLITTELGITKTNNSIDEDNEEEEYQRNVKLSEIDSKIAGVTNKINRLRQKVQSLQNAQYKEEVEEKNKAERELGDAEDQLAEMQAQKKNLPRRSKRPTIAPPNVSLKQVRRGELETFAKSKNWNSKQAEEYAKNHGWTIID